MVAEQLRAIGVRWQCIALEPEGRNTAPAIALAAQLAEAEVPGSRLLILPADHLIDDELGFVKAVKSALAACEDGSVITFGIAPTRPETGYGYIELEESGRKGVQPVRAFVEKPDSPTAARFATSRRHLWNSGMFLADARVLLEEMELLNRAVAAAVSASFREGRIDLDFFRPSEAFLKSPNVSFDVAVMEKTARSAVLPVDFGWSDIGSWESILELSGADEKGNHYAGDVLTIDVEDTLVHAGNRLVGAIGVSRLIIVESSDAVLVVDRERAQDVARLVAQLKASNRSEHLLHPEVFRPWGSFEGVGLGERYQVKRIKVKPGASISLQKHRHRAEHWVVVRGTAEVTRGEDIFTLRENESTYIPPGVKHRLHNGGEILLEIVEIQVGSYLGEDDIVRFEDRYGRAKE